MFCKPYKATYWKNAADLSLTLWYSLFVRICFSNWLNVLKPKKCPIAFWLETTNWSIKKPLLLWFSQCFRCYSKTKTLTCLDNFCRKRIIKCSLISEIILLLPEPQELKLMNKERKYNIPDQRVFSYGGGRGKAKQNSKDLEYKRDLVVAWGDS